MTALGRVCEQMVRHRSWYSLLTIGYRDCCRHGRHKVPCSRLEASLSRAYLKRNEKKGFTRTFITAIEPRRTCVTCFTIELATLLRPTTPEAQYSVLNEG